MTTCTSNPSLVYVEGFLQRKYFWNFKNDYSIFLTDFLSKNEFETIILQLNNIGKQVEDTINEYDKTDYNQQYQIFAEQSNQRKQIWESESQQRLDSYHSHHTFLGFIFFIACTVALTLTILFTIGIIFFATSKLDLLYIYALAGCSLVVLLCGIYCLLSFCMFARSLSACEIKDIGQFQDPYRFNFTSKDYTVTNDESFNNLVQTQLKVYNNDLEKRGIQMKLEKIAVMEANKYSRETDQLLRTKSEKITFYLLIYLKSNKDI